MMRETNGNLGICVGQVQKCDWVLNNDDNIKMGSNKSGLVNACSKKLRW